jgi:hypothetical protein
MLRSKITQLPPEIKAEFDKILISKSFSCYDEITGWLNEQLREAGLEITVSRSAAHRYGQEFEARIAAIKIATEQACAITDAVGDDAGKMGNALISLVQEKAFDVLVRMEDLDPENVNFEKLTVAIAKLNAAAVAQKKWQAEIRRKAEQALENIEQKTAAGGRKSLDPETRRIIKEEVYGII